MQLYILGAGEFSYCVAELAMATGKYDAVHFLDDDTGKDNVVGSIGEIDRFVSEGSEFVVAIGNNEVRMRLLAALEAAHASVAVLIHPRAHVSDSARLQPGTIVMPMAVVNSNTAIGRGCIVDCGTIIDHNCEIGDGIHFRPGAIVRPRTILESGTIVSAGEVVDMKW